MDAADEIKILIKRLEEQNNPISELVFVTVGRMQVGKSSVINSIVGKKVAETGVNIDAETTIIRAYRFEIEGVRCKVFDTPGFFDGSLQTDNSYKIEQIRKNITNFHCLLFISKLTDPFGADEIHTIRLVSEAFGHKVWEHAIAVFTWSDHYRIPQDYTQRLHQRGKRFREEVAKYAKEASNTIPCVGVDNTSLLTPDGKTWKDILITAIFKKIKEQGFIEFLFMTAGVVRWSKREEKDYYQTYDEVVQTDSHHEHPPVKKKVEQNGQNDSQVYLSQEQIKEISDRIQTSTELMKRLGDILSLIGNLFSPVVGMAGKAIGYIIAAILSLISLKKK